MSAMLIIDDDSIHRMVIGRMASKAGMRAVYASTAQEAVEQLVAGGFRCVKLDLNLGEEQGVELLETIQKHNPGADVILVSGSDDQSRQSALRTARTLGLSIYDFPKPIDLSAMRTMFESEAQRKVGGDEFVI